MSWKKYFKVADNTGNLSPISGAGNGSDQGSFAYRNYASSLKEVYSGHPNRVERYNQYEAMDMDSEVNACLDSVDIIVLSRVFLSSDIFAKSVALIPFGFISDDFAISVDIARICVSMPSL